VLLQQLVIVPQSVFKESAYCGTPKRDVECVPVRVTDVAGKVSAALSRMGAPSTPTSGGVFGKSTVTYVNSVSVFVGVSPDGDRVAMVMTTRFFPDAKKVDEFNGRTVDRSAGPASKTAPTVDVLGMGGTGLSCSPCPNEQQLRAGGDASSTDAGTATAAGTAAAPVPDAAAAMFVRTLQGKVALMQAVRPAAARAVLPPWINLRVSFLKLVPGGDDPAAPFALDDVQDDLVRTFGGVVGELRAQKCLAEVRGG
jgi:hypothetical protein